MYICNGYKLTYNKIFELFGDDYISVEKSKFKTENEANDNIWVNVFKSKDDFENFKYYIENKITDDYADLSFLFQKLLYEKKISRIKHLDFNNWLLQNRFIKEKVFNDIQNQNGFRSLNKSFSKHRENNYLEIFKN